MTAMLALLLFSPAVYGFSFTVDNPNPAQCGQLDINWVGGTPPFRLLVLPAFDYPSNITLPESSWDGNGGVYSWTANYPTDTQLVFLMSDSTGVGTGGVSPLYKMGSPGNSSCNLRSTDVDFYFYLNETSVTQCNPVQVYWDDTATSPVSIIGAIPGGQPFMFESPGVTTSLDWITNIASGSQFILAAFDDGQHGTGGSSALMTVGSSGSTVCLDDSSPSSTASSPSTTSTSTGTRPGGVKTVTAVTTATPKGAAGLGSGAIAGIAVAAIAVVLVVQGALFYFCCRRQFGALLSHRRQMKERVTAGEVDLADGDGATSLRNVDTSTLLQSDMDGGSVSPFYDHSPGTRGPFDTPPETEFAFPRQGHDRQDSLGTQHSKVQAEGLAGSSRPDVPGGIRLHEDAGRVDMEELPPVYRSEWETDSQQSGGR